MTTASEVIVDAASLILVDEENTSLDASSVLIFTRFLNDYLAELYTDGIDIGYRPVSSPSDFVTIPEGANMAVKYGLALRINDVFGLPMPTGVPALAERLERKLRSSYMRLPKVSPPRTLPIGSGNHYNVYDNATFYAKSTPEGRQRLDSATTVTIAADNTPTIISGPWATDRLINVNSTGNGTFEYPNTDDYLARVRADLTMTSTNGDNYTFMFLRNGAPLRVSSFEVTANVSQNIKLQFVDTIFRGDTISIAVENNTGTNDVTISKGHFILD